MRLVDLVLSWLRVVSRPKPVPRRYPRVACPVCGLVVASSAVSPTRHKCRKTAVPTMQNKTFVVSGDTTYMIDETAAKEGDA